MSMFTRRKKAQGRSWSETRTSRSTKDNGFESEQLNQVDLQALVEKISLEFFGRPFQHQAIYNSRLQTTGGRYHLKDHHIDFNPKMANRPEFIGIIKHELTHYHLHLAHRGYQHRDADFKKLLAQVGGSRYAPNIKSSQAQQGKWHYRCEHGHDFFRQRRVDINRYRCGQCRGKLHLVDQLK